MNYLQKLPDSSARMKIASDVGNAISFTTPEAAIAWLEGFDDTRMRTAVATSMGGNLAQRDVETAAKLLDRVPKEARRQWTQFVAIAYAMSDPVKGADWLAKNGDLSSGAIQSFAGSLTVIDPDVALKVIDRFDGKQRQAVLQGALPRIAQQAPETAANMVDDITDPNARAGTVMRIAETWAQYDEPAARKWVLSMPWGQARDNGIQAIIGQTVATDDRVSLIGQIQSPETRMQAIWAVASSDPETARTVMRRYPLDPQHQAQLEAALRQRRGGDTYNMQDTYMEASED
jgi:hypothetical protein